MAAGAFHVNLQGMGSLWTKVDQLSGISESTAGRVRKYARPDLLSAGTGIYIDIMQPGLKHTWDQAQNFALGTSEVIDHLGKNIQGARNFYASGDARAGAGFDELIDDIGAPDGKALAGRPTPDSRSKANDLGCTWPEDPAIRAGEPASSPDFKFEFNVNTGDLLKLTAYIREAFEKVFDTDPVERFLKPFIGDWDALYKSGVEFELYAKSFKAMGNSLQFLSDQVPVVWDGQASQNAREQMLDLGRKIAASEGDFKGAANAFKVAAKDAYEAYDYVVGKVTDVVDLMIPIAGEVNAGGKLAKEAAATLKNIEYFYKVLTDAAGDLETQMKKLKALPESVNVPRPQIKGYSVTLGGWFKSSKQGPYQPAN
ncbi:MAG TPA: hypothetical protein VGF17_23955 [Phytomonospora sp.]